MTYKRSKSSRHRGSHTHGGGAMKKRRGAGSRGGRGNAGSGKRGDVKKPSYWKDKNYFGKQGFSPINKKVVNAINLSDLDKYEGEVNLKEMGYHKLLGAGNLTKKLTIKVDYASKKAVEKVESAGGKVLLE